MSFTVDFFIEDLPSDEQEAWKLIEKMREEYYEDESEKSELLLKLGDVLTSKYPCLTSYDDDDPAMDDSPWADGPMTDNMASKMGMIAIRYSHVEEVFPFVLESAINLGLIVVDGQSEQIYRPGHLIPEPKSKKPWWQIW